MKYEEIDGKFPARLNRKSSIINRKFPAAFLVLLLLPLISCGRRKMSSDELSQNPVFAEILKREAGRVLGEDGFFPKNLFSNPYSEVRNRCAVALGRIGDRRALSWLYTALYKGDASVRATSAFAIGEIEDRELLQKKALSIDPQTLPELSRLLNDPSPFVQMRAMEALGKAGSHAEAVCLIDRLERYPIDRLPGERAYADFSIAALIRIGDPAACPILKKLSEAGDPDIQWRALDALIQLRDRSAQPWFIKALSNPDPLVAAQAMRGLGMTEDPALAIRLLPFLAPTTSPILRYTAVQALGALRNPEAIPEIQAAIESAPIDNAHPDQLNFAIAAASSLGSIGSPRAESTLLSLLRKSEPVAAGAVVALAKILKGSQERFFSLADRQLFVHPTAQLAWSQALVELGKAEAVKEMNAILLQNQLQSAGMKPDAGSAQPGTNISDSVCIALAASRINHTTAIIETSRGEIEIELFRDDAPVTTAKFIGLANRGAFEGLRFSHVSPFSLIQIEEPTIQAPPGWNIGCEINMHPFERGSVGMVLAAKDSQANQFFIALNPLPGRDGLEPCFGRVISGIQAADRIVPGDYVKKVHIKERIGLFRKHVF
jgi:peptidyl-prolyl cis-trans isomerase B (cyclophilin B)